MNPRLSVAACLAICFGLSTTVTIVSARLNPAVPAAVQERPLFVAPAVISGGAAGTGKSWKVRSTDTAGLYALTDTIVPPQAGPIPHRHSREDEAFYILDGQVQFRVGGRTFDATRGAFVFAPRGIPHAFRNITAQPARMIGIISPAGLENFLDETDALAKQLPASDPSYARRYQEIGERYGVEFRTDWNFPPPRSKP
jgi:mannose-6-phosphate isomerase-like protein (cupin superfamily)